MSELPDRAGARAAAARPMAEMPVRVRFGRRESSNRWQSVSWYLEAVEPADDGPFVVQVYRDEAEGYYLNVTSTEPSIFVLWRRQEDMEAGDAVAGLPEGEPESGPRAIAVTVSYNEAGRWMDGGEQVDRVPMLQGMCAWLVDFVNQHYKPEQSRKRKGPKMSFMDREAHARLAEAERSGPGPGKVDP
jgi:hypothetical protein